jgi:hypothetical protein
MPEPRAPYRIEFYEDDDGREPALLFMQSLTPAKRRAVGVALNEFLGHLGPNVVATDFGKNLGGGLLEFRVDQDAAQILRKAGKDPRPEPDPGKILLRVFFHAHGTKLILLLSGYDKGERPSKIHQERPDRAGAPVPQALERTGNRLLIAKRIGGGIAI